MSSKRALRIGYEIRSALSNILQKKNHYGTIIDNVIIIVSRVCVSDSLRHAKVYISALGKESELEYIADCLNEQAWDLRKRLRSAVYLKFIPYLLFVVDKYFQEAKAIDKILSKNKNKSV